MSPQLSAISSRLSAHGQDSGSCLLPSLSSSDLSDAQRRQIGQRVGILKAWQQTLAAFDRTGRSRRAGIAAFLGSNPGIKRSTLYRWARAYADGGGEGLLDGRSNRVRDAAHADPTAQMSDDAWRYFLGYYLAPQRRTIALCYLITAEKAHEQGWAWPSRRTVGRRVRELDSFWVDAKRLGPEEWKRRHEPKLAFRFLDYRANEMWVGDGHECDVFCRRSDDDPRICRPLLSAFLDLRSRMLVSWHIGLHENQDAILLSFRRGVELHGPPEHVTIDNGKPYRAYGVSGGRPTTRRTIDDEDYVRSVMGGLNVAVHFSIPHNPNSKIIEGWFHTLESQFGALFESHCGGSTKDERFHLAYKLAHEHPERCPTVAELAERFGEYLEGYHATPHAGEGIDGLTPAEAMVHCDPIPKRIAPPGALDLLLLRTTKPLRVTDRGIVYKGIRYGAFDPRVQRMHGQEVLLRIDPVDAGTVVVCDLEGRPLFTAANNRAALADLSQVELAEGMAAKRRARRMARDIADGAMTPLRDDPVTAGLRARVNAGKRAAAAKRTGTDDAPVRNVTPLRSDWTEAMERFATERPSDGETEGRSDDAIGPDDIIAIRDAADPTDPAGDDELEDLRDCL